MRKNLAPEVQPAGRHSRKMWGTSVKKTCVPPDTIFRPQHSYRKFKAWEVPRTQRHRATRISQEQKKAAQQKHTKNTLRTCFPTQRYYTA